VDADRARKIGLNEAVFREVNERIEEVAEAFGLESRLDLVCECGDAGCTERIALAPEEYAAVREHPAQFAVYPGHDTVDVETVVAKRDRYEVVRKHEGVPEALAEATDPRS
jgi:hypothetical protein